MSPLAGFASQMALTNGFPLLLLKLAPSCGIRSEEKPAWSREQGGRTQAA